MLYTAITLFICLISCVEAYHCFPTRWVRATINVLLAVATGAFTLLRIFSGNHSVYIPTIPLFPLSDLAGQSVTFYVVTFLITLLLAGFILKSLSNINEKF